MPFTIPLSALGTMVRKKRGAQKLREVAQKIGVTAPTLMRIEAGRMPDVTTFGKVCLWLEVDSGEFLGRPSKPENSANDASAEPAVRVSAHFRAEKLPLPETANALARMLLFLAQRQAISTLDTNDGNA